MCESPNIYKEYKEYNKYIKHPQISRSSLPLVTTSYQYSLPSFLFKGRNRKRYQTELMKTSCVGVGKMHRYEREEKKIKKITTVSFGCVFWGEGGGRVRFLLQHRD